MRPEEDGRGLVMDGKMEPGSHGMVVTGELDIEIEQGDKGDKGEEG